MECPKCHYVRGPEDTAPDYECPRCGVVYAKAKQQIDLERVREDVRRKTEETQRRAALGECVDCGGLVSPRAVICPHCGRPFGDGVQAVSVVDVGMPFDSMVMFLIKWALAALPAALIIAVLYGVLVLMLGFAFR